MLDNRSSNRQLLSIEERIAALEEYPDDNEELDDDHIIGDDSRSRRIRNTKVFNEFVYRSAKQVTAQLKLLQIHAKYQEDRA